MYRFDPDTVTVTERNLVIGGAFDLGPTKRFATIAVPLELVLSGSVLEALQAAALIRARHVEREWEQFLLWG